MSWIQTLRSSNEEPAASSECSLVTVIFDIMSNLYDIWARDVKYYLHASPGGMTCHSFGIRIVLIIALPLAT
jgi:hypothetical protein